ncbi:MAG: ATP-binding protein [Oceanidesulfovibrio sp.]
MITNLKRAQTWQITIALAVLLLAVAGAVYLQQKHSYESIRRESIANIAEQFATHLESPASAGAEGLRTVSDALFGRWPIEHLEVLDSRGAAIFSHGRARDGIETLAIPIQDTPGAVAPGGTLHIRYALTGFNAHLANLVGLLILCNAFILLLFHGLLRLLQRRREKAESLLEHHEERLRLALEASSDGIWENNIQDGTHFLSDRMYTMLGYEPGDPEEAWRFLYEQVHLEDREKVTRGRQLMFEGLRETLVTRYRMRRKDGEWRHILCRAKVVAVDLEGKPARIAGTFTDVTPLVDAEEALASLNRELEERVEQRTNALAQKAEELAEANRQLRELDQLKSSFLSSVSHELRTPLTSILGFARLIDKEFEAHFKGTARTEREERAGRRIQNNLRIIANQGERLSRLVNDVLDLNKIESGMMDWRDEEVDPKAVVTRAIEATLPLLEGNPNVVFTPEIQPDLPRVIVDADRLEQVLINLLNNAVKFTERGHVSLMAEGDESGALRISVADTGLGIPPNALEDIFEKFHQLPTDALHGKPGGTGLGLFISREIVRHYDGKLWVDSKVGRGSTFTLLLPGTNRAESAA